MSYDSRTEKKHGANDSLALALRDGAHAAGKKDNIGVGSSTQTIKIIMESADDYAKSFKKHPDEPAR